jgi:TolB protein
MDIILKLAGFLGAGIAAVMTVVMLLTFRKPRRITSMSSLVSILLSGILLPVYIWLSGVPINYYVGFPFLCLGLLIGFLRGQTTQLRYVGEEVVGQHSWLFLLAWGSSLVLSQLLNLFGGGLLASLGLLPVFLSTGTQIGIYGNLLLRRMAMVRPELEPAGISNATFNRAIGWGFGSMILLLLLSSAVLSVSTVELFQFSPAEAALAEVAAPQPIFDEPEVPPIVEPDITATPTEAPLFSSTEVLIWTRPDWAFLVDGPYELYAVDVETQQARTVMETPVTTLITPELSPDGRTLAYMRRVDENTDIYARPLVSGDPVRLTDNPDYDTNPVWSPDGQWILFRSDREGRHHVYRMRADGSEQSSLYSDTLRISSPMWSHDGGRIAFYVGEMEATELFVMNADGSNVKQITQTPAGWVRILAARTDGSGQDPLGNALDDPEASWSPDGTQIAYAFLQTEGDIWQRQIYKMNVDGSGAVNLSNNLYSDAAPVWSPDGRWIVYESMGDMFTPGAESMWEVFVMRSDGSDQRRLTNHLWPEDSLPTKVFWP